MERIRKCLAKIVLASPTGTGQTALQGFEWRFLRCKENQAGLPEPACGPGRTPVLIRLKVRLEAFPTGLLCSVTRSLRLFG
jgi:hypothetical protein